MKYFDKNWLLRRLSQRLRSLVPLVLMALILGGLLHGVLNLGYAVLPLDWQRELTLLKTGDWTLFLAHWRLRFETYPLWFLGIQFLQVLFAPIPGQLMGFAGGYVFGFYRGLAMTMLGLSLGSISAMLIGRFARRFLAVFVSETTYHKFETFVSGGGTLGFFLLFLLPGLPDDALCFMAGLSVLPLYRLFWVMFVGRLPGMAVLSWLGASSQELSPPLVVLLVVCVLLALGVWFFQEELESWLQRKIKAVL